MFFGNCVNHSIEKKLELLVHVNCCTCCVKLLSMFFVIYVNRLIEEKLGVTCAYNLLHLLCKLFQMSSDHYSVDLLEKGKAF